MSQQKRTNLLSKFTGKATLPQVPGGKVGMTNLGDRGVASAPVPQETISAGANRTQVYTYFTKPQLTGSDIQPLYNGDRLWARLRLTLETAGPVAVGQSSQILPVLSGKGILLPTNQEVDIVIAKGTKLYIASTSVNRVKVIVEPVPWLEQITSLLISIAGKAVDKVKLVKGAQRSKL